jgi:hypothetical protein
VRDVSPSWAKSSTLSPAFSVSFCGLAFISALFMASNDVITFRDRKRGANMPRVKEHRCRSASQTQLLVSL